MRWCARCRDPELRRTLGLREPTALPAWLEARLVARDAGSAGDPGREAGGATARVHVFDPVRQSAPGWPGFSGLRIYPDALRPDEARALLREIEQTAWRPSQSGKRKQHFGPRFNFIRRRMNPEGFEGLPSYATLLEERFRELLAADPGSDASALAACRRAAADYRTTDVFVLRYLAAEASNLDLHVDDDFAYGALILDVSLESDSVMTFVGPLDADPEARVCIRAPLPARSIAALYGPARFAWQHGILPQDIAGTRTSITLRTLGDAPRATPAGQRVETLARTRL